MMPVAASTTTIARIATPTPQDELRASDLARLSDRVRIARDVDAEIAERRSEREWRR